MIRHHCPNPILPRRVIVFGASGFIGSELVRRLQTSGIPTLALGSAHLDLCGPQAVEALPNLLTAGDAIVFAAALTPDRGNDVSSLMRNLRMAETLASLERFPCAHLVYLSSDAVYDTSDSLLSEWSRPAPPSLYGHMHLLREKILADAAGWWGCPFLVLRPCAVYGPGDTHNSYGPNRFCRSALQQQRIVLFGHGEEGRDHVSVQDLTRLLELSLRYRSEGLLNVATGRSISFQALATLIAEMVDPTVTIEYEERRTPITHRHFDITEALRAFPFFRFGELRTELRAFLDAGRTVQAA